MRMKPTKRSLSLIGLASVALLGACPPPNPQTRVLAGTLNECGSRDGRGSEARISNTVRGLAYDRRTQAVFFADLGNATVRRVDLITQEVTTVAGMAGEQGTTDGPPNEARFFEPTGLALNSGGTRLYVSDRASHTIRVIDLRSPTVSTVAGTAGVAGQVDGQGLATQFSAPTSMAYDDTEEVLYVADTGNAAIRGIEAGTVTTVVGAAGPAGCLDAAQTQAQIGFLQGLVLHPLRRELYLGDTLNDAIRRVRLDTFQVDTIAGTCGSPGWVDGASSLSRFYGPRQLAVGPQGEIYVADLRNATVRRVDIPGFESRTVLGNPQRQEVRLGLVSDASPGAVWGVAITDTNELITAGSGCVLLRTPLD
jgi:hypothetical protein